MTRQNLINEGQNAQLIVQNMGIEAMAHILYEKKKLKQIEQVALFSNSNIRYLIASEFVELKRKKKDEKAKEEEEGDSSEKKVQFNE